MLPMTAQMLPMTAQMLPIRLETPSPPRVFTFLNFLKAL